MGRAAWGSGAAGWLVFVQSCLQGAVLLAMYPVAVWLGGVAFGRFARAAAPAQGVGFGTQSSLATLPVMLDAATRGLQIPARIAGVLIDRRVDRLSGGQRAQVALCLALAKRPQLLLLDEPLASLDPLARREFLSTMIDAVAETPTTVVLSSHLITDLERVCDHLLVLHAGRVQVFAETDQLLATHKILIGPGGPRRATIAGVEEVVHATDGQRQSTLLVRTNAQTLETAWEQRDITLEDLVLAYLAANVEPLPDRQEVSA